MSFAVPTIDELIKFMEREIEDDKLDPSGVNPYRVQFQQHIIEELARLRDLQR